MRYHFTLIRVANINKQEIQVFVRMWRKGNPGILLVGLQIGVATMESSIEVSQKIKIEIPHNPTIPILEIYAK